MLWIRRVILLRELTKGALTRTSLTKYTPFFPYIGGIRKLKEIYSSLFVKRLLSTRCNRQLLFQFLQKYDVTYSSRIIVSKELGDGAVTQTSVSAQPFGCKYLVPQRAKQSVSLAMGLPRWPKGPRCGNRLPALPP